MPLSLRSVRGDGPNNLPTCPLDAVDADGVGRYEQVADHPADRTDGNWVRDFVRNGFENVFGG